MHCKYERQCIVYIYNMYGEYIQYMYIIYVNNTLPLVLAVHKISRHFWAAYGQGSAPAFQRHRAPTSVGRPMVDEFFSTIFGLNFDLCLIWI